MRYEEAPDLQAQAQLISEKLFPHIDMTRVKCFKSRGTSTGRTVARCHGLGKLMQKALNVEAAYALEFLSERFDKMSEEEKIALAKEQLAGQAKNEAVNVWLAKIKLGSRMSLLSNILGLVR